MLESTQKGQDTCGEINLRSFTLAELLDNPHVAQLHKDYQEANRWAMKAIDYADENVKLKEELLAYKIQQATHECSHQSQGYIYHGATRFGLIANMTNIATSQFQVLPTFPFLVPVPPTQLPCSHASETPLSDHFNILNRFYGPCKIARKMRTSTSVNLTPLARQ